jgi:alpha-L-rhamnosidase
MGATTIWERWDSLLPDGSINPGQMTSFNHYALGAIADWLHRTVGGLAPAAPGYRHLNVQPHVGGGLTYARTRHLTPYGLTESAWTIKAEQIEVVVVVPPNVTASVTLPEGNGPPIEVGSGTHRWSYPYHVKRSRHPRSLDSTISEFIDDPEAWTTVLNTMRQHMSELASHMDIGTVMQRNGDMTLGQMLSLLPHAAELRTALEAALTTLER